jgi:ADP-heptose:LPS heptosyltransferase
MLPQLVRAPDHLGDCILALPAIRALASARPSWIQGPRWCSWLYRDCNGLTQKPSRFGKAILFKPSFSAAWSTLSIPERIGLRSDARGWLLSQAIQPGEGHRIEDYARIARAAGVEVSDLPSFRPSEAERAESPDVPENAALLLPATASGPPVAWPGFADLAESLKSQGLTPIFTGGPGEDAQVRAAAGEHRVIRSLGLGSFAALCTQVQSVHGNDSGLSHLAAAARRGAGLSPADVHVYCGSTDPLRTAPPGSRAFRHASPPACWPCYRKRCRHSLECMPSQSSAEQVQGPSSTG